MIDHFSSKRQKGVVINSGEMDTVAAKSSGCSYGISKEISSRSIALILFFFLQLDCAPY